MARQEREMAKKNLQAQQVLEEQERKAYLQKRAEIGEHAVSLQGQITKNQEVRDIQRAEYEEEGR